MKVTARLQRRKRLAPRCASSSGQRLSSPGRSFPTNSRRAIAAPRNCALLRQLDQLRQLLGGKMPSAPDDTRPGCGRGASSRVADSLASLRPGDRCRGTMVTRLQFGIGPSLLLQVHQLGELLGGEMLAGSSNDRR